MEFGPDVVGEASASRILGDTRIRAGFVHRNFFFRLLFESRLLQMTVPSAEAISPTQWATGTRKAVETHATAPPKLQGSAMFIARRIRKESSSARSGISRSRSESTALAEEHISPFPRHRTCCSYIRLRLRGRPAFA